MRHQLDKNIVAPSLLKCPNCHDEMGFRLEMLYCIGATNGPYLKVMLRQECSNHVCRYYERSEVHSVDDKTLKNMEQQIQNFADALPSLGRWKRYRVTNKVMGPYRPRRR